MTVIDGEVAEGYGWVADEFARNFAERGETGAACAVTVGGETVVDVWGGVADIRDGRPWRRDTLSVMFSCGKGLMTIAALRLVEEGRLLLDAPVTDYWPEYGAAGKERTTVRHLLAHRAGLVAPDVDLGVPDLVAWDPVVRALEAQAPLWEPGTAWTYHTITHGWLVGEVIRRVTGTDPGSYLHGLIRPLARDTWLGLPFEHESRVTWLDQFDQPSDPRPGDPRSGDPVERTLARASTLGGALPVDLVAGQAGFNDPRLHAAQVPGAGIIGTARDLARIWSATVVETDGIRLLSSATTEDASRVQSTGEPFLTVPGPWPAWGTGFLLSNEAFGMLTPRSFGHNGAGGQLGFADPDTGIGLGYLTNRMMRSADTRSGAIMDAVRSRLV